MPVDPRAAPTWDSHKKELWSDWASDFESFAALADAEELVQDVFLKVWEKREILDAAQNVKAYIFKIAINTIYDFIRRKNIESAFNDFARENYERNSRRFCFHERRGRGLRAFDFFRG